MSKAVMVVEDDPEIRMVISIALEDEGFRVLEAESGERALLLAQDEDPDVVLVDLRLPGIHGFDVVRSLRATSRVPIIVVTAQADSEDVVTGLEAGADDYVTKPFVTKELVARVRAQIRRSGDEPGDEGLLECGEVKLHPDTAEASVAGRMIPLSPTEYKLLAELIGARERVVSRDDLLRNVWGYRNPGDGRVVDNLVYRLRAKMEPDPAEPIHLLTVRGFGYRLKA
ncbi:MAG: response regulator [Candidatus Nanopelagicales bacterium]